MLLVSPVLDWAYLEAAHIPLSIDFKLCSFLTTDPGGFLHLVQTFLPVLPLLIDFKLCSFLTTDPGNFLDMVLPLLSYVCLDRGSENWWIFTYGADVFANSTPFNFCVLDRDHICFIICRKNFTKK